MPNSPGGSWTPLRREAAHERGPDAGRLEVALDLAVLDAGLLEGEDVLGQDLVVLDPVDLGDVDDLARAVLEPGRMDDEVDGRGDLLADGAQRHLVAGHQDHRLEARSMSGGLLAWPVESEPSWPVVIAWSMSSASPARHSPTMIRSGRMWSALRSRSRMVISPWPSRFGGRASSVTTCVLAELQLGGVLDGDDPLVARG